MKQSLLMPKLGLTMVEGYVAEWSVAPGQAFKAGDCLFVVETDKVATEVPADADGVLLEILVEAGNTVAVGVLLGHWEGEGSGATTATPAPVAETPAEPAPEASVAQAVAAALPVSEKGRIRATPLARRVAGQLQVDLGQLSGSGPRGRIKAGDVHKAAAKPQPQVVADKVASPPASEPARSKPGSVQAAMARRLTEAKQQVPHFYLALDVRVDALLDLRSQLNALAPERGGVRLTLNHFVLAAVGRALVDLPAFNRVWSDGEIVSFERADVGVAVNTDKGLFVPIVRGAGNVSLEHLAREASRLVDAARTGGLTVPDMQGGAVTVSNAGMFQVRYMTPIINPGQAMILGVGAINETFRPGADGAPQLVREMGLVLAADHRILDGVSGLTFLNQVAGYLSQPLKLLVGTQ